MPAVRRSPSSASSIHQLLPPNDENNLSLPFTKPHKIVLVILACLLLAGCLTLRFYPGYSLAIREGNDHKEDGSLIGYSVIYSHDYQQDRRGWLLNPVTAAAQTGLRGGAEACKAVHVGQIKPGGVRGNHRHRACNETFIIWGAKTRFRLEDPGMEKGYAELFVGADKVVVATSPRGRAHALVNVDRNHITYFLGCQDAVLDKKNLMTDFDIWKNL